MFFNFFIPDFLKEYIYLTKLKMKFRSCKIYSFRIAKNVEMGKSVIIMNNAVVHKNCKISDYSYINSNTFLGYAEIGKFSSVGCNCQIGVPIHPSNYISTSPFTYGPNNLFDVPSFYEEFQTKTIIGNDCWIGSNVVIMQGVRIGDGAIVGAGSVVTKDVPPYSVVAGIPSKFIKLRFNQEKIDALMDLKWWEKDIEKIKEYKHLFISGDKWYFNMK
ncbi:2,3,4,5-tetrahydropyridine-2,6-dicarboxylate N-acetyltransferase [Paenibacillus auburnensis]|uniref:2,3,4,5-tetrahydropyridine-2,6-dicarboxylate N-acetyltransferase n=1 Tax=Paenibacillus auburnensis TaxID=2905649 RepID=A0ABM9CUV8_9BACL|nr:CatB-related O-acetyltransferase [Paenibacillus auburnensis]CAH1225188.1 2,3,4,5-tetrahydropyridine-2,6-dicarboxylate N-acetyltransferase [Paenibacillus auburnensis]